MIPTGSTSGVFNPTEAEKIVKELYPDGVTVQIWGWAENAMQIIQADLAKIGINMEIVTKEYGVALPDIKSGELQVSWRGWAYGIPDGQNFLEPEDRVGFCKLDDKTRWPSRSTCDETQNQFFLEMNKLAMDDPKRTEIILKFEDYF